MKHGEPTHSDITRCVAEVRHDADLIGENVPVGDHYTFGICGRTARILKKRNLIQLGGGKRRFVLIIEFVGRDDRNELVQTHKALFDLSLHI